jgi:hypothetical protein
VWGCAFGFLSLVFGCLGVSECGLKVGCFWVFLAVLRWVLGAERCEILLDAEAWLYGRLFAFLGDVVFWVLVWYLGWGLARGLLCLSVV